MQHAQYKTMISAQDTQRANAWAFILEAWHTPTWKRIPDNIINVLGLPKGLGMCSGNFMMQVSANGMNEFINHMNRNRSV